MCRNVAICGDNIDKFRRNKNNETETQISNISSIQYSKNKSTRSVGVSSYYVKTSGQATQLFCSHRLFPAYMFWFPRIHESWTHRMWPIEWAHPRCTTAEVKCWPPLATVVFGLYTVLINCFEKQYGKQCVHSATRRVCVPVGLALAMEWTNVCASVQCTFLCSVLPCTSQAWIHHLVGARKHRTQKCHRFVRRCPLHCQHQVMH